MDLTGKVGAIFFISGGIIKLSFSKCSLTFPVSHAHRSVDKMSNIRYLNVDLLINSKEDLTPIVDSFGEDVIALYNGEWGAHYRANFEIAGSHAASNEDISYFCSLVDGLEGEAKKLWDNALSKEFDIGFEPGSGPESYNTEIKPSIVKRVADIGASISLTIYPVVDR